MLYRFRYFVFIFLSLAVFQGCEERENYDEDLNPVLNTISSLEGNGTQATIDHLRGTINLVLPPRTDITNVELNIDAPEGVEVQPTSGTTIDLSERIEISAVFGNSIRNYQLITRVLPSKIAFLGEASSFEKLLETADDDIAEAAQWVQETYNEDFEYLSVEDVTYEQLQEINVVVFYYDQVGSSELPEAFTEGRPNRLLSSIWWKVVKCFLAEWLPASPKPWAGIKVDYLPYKAMEKLLILLIPGL